MGSQHGSGVLSSGSKSSKPSEEKKKFVDSTLSFQTSTSSYNGLKTETSKSMSNEGSIGSRGEKEPEEKVPTFFEWKEGGNAVLITGDFCGWSHQFTMNFNNATGYYELLLYLPKGLYQFKFIVDGKWRCSQFLPTVGDNNNNVNNYVDNSKKFAEDTTKGLQEGFIKNKIMKEKNIETQNEEKRRNEDKENEKDDGKINNLQIQSKDKSSDETNASSKKRKSEKSINKKTSNIPYDQIYPTKKDVNVEAPNVPQVYSKRLTMSFRADSKYGLGNKNYMNHIERSENNCFKILLLPSHVNLNHLFTKCRQYQNFNALCTCVRVRKKFISVVYCQPANRNV